MKTTADEVDVTTKPSFSELRQEWLNGKLDFN